MAAWWRGYIAKRARQLGLDPAAVLAVAAQEGLGGGVGDQGSSYGPFQLHRGGALPAGRDRAWAESPAGIDYALSRIAGVARGQRGQQAISSIVSRFERPADPQSEIQGALAAYGGIRAHTPTAGGAAVMPPPGGGGAQDLSGLRSNLVQSLIAANQQTSGHRSPDYSGVFSAIAGLRQAQSVGSAARSTATGATARGAGPSSGGSSLSFLTPLAKRFGLTITSTTEGQHVKGSYHYSGRAEDYGGDPRRMAALQRYALAHPGEFVESFYTGPGAAPYFVKNGKVYPISQLDPSTRAGHRDHVHLAR
jgi:hypothetical protein